MTITCVTDSRIADASRAWQAGCNVDVTGWDKASEFILSTWAISDLKNDDADFTLQWRRVGGSFVDVGADTEVCWGVDTVLTDNGVLASGNSAGCLAPWDSGRENEGDNACLALNIAAGTYWEGQWALGFGSGALDSQEYEIQITCTTYSNVATCQTTITTAAGAAVLTLGNFCGFETGGLEEAETTVGSASVQSGTKRSGGFAIQLAAGDSYTIAGRVGGHDGNDYVDGFAVRFSSLSPSSDGEFWRAWEGASRVIRLALKTDGNLALLDQTGTQVAVTSTSPFTAGSWHVVEIWWQNDDPANCKVNVDGSEKLSVTAEDFLDTTPGNVYNRIFVGIAGITTYMDDWYCYSGASGPGDFLGPNVEVLGSYQNTVEDATDQGTTLDQGTWADTGDTPVEEEATPAGYTTTTPADGHTICDEGTRSGPAGDAGGTIKGAKWIHRLKKTADTATTHQKRYGHNGDTAVTTIVPTTAYANYFTVLDSSDSKCPTNSEYFAQGFAKNGAEYLYCAEMWACLLHIAGAGIVKIMSSTLGLSEAEARRAWMNRLVSETVGLPEAPVRRMWSIRLKAETLGIIDSLLRKASSVRLIAETVGIAETFVKVTFTTIVKIMSSTVDLGDAALRRLRSIRVKAESIGITEVLLRRLWSVRQMASAISVQEAIIRRMWSVRQKAETISISEGFVKITGIIKQMAETIGITETALRIAGFVKIASETILISETMSRVAGFVKVMVETISLAETKLRRMWAIRQMIEIVGLLDTLLRRMWSVRVISSALSLADSLLRQAISVRLATETMSISEAGILHKSIVKIISETIGLVESWLKILTQILRKVDVIEFWAPITKGVELTSTLTKETELESPITKEVELDARLE